MNKEDTLIITEYIAVWGWQIMAIIFLTSFFLAFSIENTIMMYMVAFIFIAMFVFCEYNSLKRRRDLLNKNEGH